MKRPNDFRKPGEAPEGPEEPKRRSTPRYVAVAYFVDQDGHERLERLDCEDRDALTGLEEAHRSKYADRRSFEVRFFVEEPDGRTRELRSSPRTTKREALQRIAEAREALRPGSETF